MGLSNTRWRTITSGTLAALALASAASAQIKISQVYGGASSTATEVNGDFVELFNAGSSPVDMTGWSLQVGGTGTGTWSKFDFPANTVIQPGRYAVARLQTTTLGIAYAADFTTAIGDVMISTYGKVAVMRNQTLLTTCPTTDIEDLFGYGSAGCFEGTVRASGTHTFGGNQTFQRNTGGCTDTASSSNDFTIAAANPRSGVTVLADVTPGGLRQTGDSITFSFGLGSVFNNCGGSSGVISGVGPNPVCTINLTSLNGGAAVPLTGPDANGLFTLAYAIPAGVLSGSRSVTINYSDDTPRTLTRTLTVPVLNFTDLGTLTESAPIVASGTLAATEVKWFKVALPAASGALLKFVDIDTEGTNLAPANNTSMTLYSAAGTIVTTDTADGSGNLSQLSYGCGYRPAAGAGATIGTIYNGRDGALTAGTYFLAVSSTAATAAANFAVASTSTNTGPFTVTLRAGNYSPAPLPVLPAAPAAGSVTEVEPNETKATATSARLAPGQTITGVTTGATTTAGATSYDYFLVYTDRQPGIKRNRLTLSSTTAGNILTLRGLTQTAPNAGPGLPTLASDDEIQATSATGTSYVQWYALGTALTPAAYVRVAGTTASTANYTLTLSSDDVVPADIAGGPFTPGPITITTIGTTGATQTDTDFWVYDSNFNPIPGFGRDDDVGTGVGGGTLTRTYAAGTYYLAMGRYDLENIEVAATDDNFRTGGVMDFPGVTARDGTATTANIDVSFKIGETVATQRTVAATLPGAFDVSFFRFQVGSGGGGCNAADITNLGGSGGPDGQLTVDDLIKYLGYFLGGDIRADLTNLGGSGGPDGQLTADDLIKYLGLFLGGAGC